MRLSRGIQALIFVTGSLGANSVHPSRSLALAVISLAIAGCGGGGGGGGGSSGGGGTVADPPTLEISASPTTVFSGQASVLTWRSSGASSCSASGAWKGSQPVVGSRATATLSTSATYVLDCKGSGGTIRRSVTVAVFPDPAPPLFLQAAFGDRSITVAWASLAGSYYAGFPVTTNVYVSTTPNIDVRNFRESATSQVKRGLNNLLSVVFEGLTNGTPVYIVATDEANGRQSAPTPEITVTPRPVGPLVDDLVALNDTGVDGCTDLETRSLPCPVPLVPGQDGEHGRDAKARDGQLTKTGIGPAGFDFTKLDAAGNPLPDDAVTWPCIRDNVTGLIWEVPGGTGLTSPDNVYTWYQPDPMLNGGWAGQPNGGSCVGSACDTDAFIKALNDTRYCGFADWRLPNRRELFSLADLTLTNDSLPAAAFPNLPPRGFMYIWSSTTVSATAGVGGAAWAMQMQWGEMTYKPKWLANLGDRPGFILAVRADASR